MKLRAHSLDPFESMPDGVLIVEPSGLITFASTNAERILGFKNGELTGEDVSRLVPQRSRPTHANLVRSFFESPVPRAMSGGLDLTAVRADGTEIPVDIALSSWNDGGEPKVIASIRDVTASRQAAANVARQRDSLREIARITSALATADPDLKSVIDAAAAALAQGPGDACAIAMLDLVEVDLPTGETSGSWQESSKAGDVELLAHLSASIVERAMITGETQVLNHSPNGLGNESDFAHSVHRLGESNDASFVVTPLRVGNTVVGTLVMARHHGYTEDECALIDDITGRVSLSIDRAGLHDRLSSALADLALSREQYRLLAENSTDVVAQIDTNLAIKWISPNKIFPPNPNRIDLEGRQLSDLLQWEDRRTSTTQLRSVIEDGRTREWNARLQAGDQDPIWMSIQARSHRDEAGVINGCVLGFRDVQRERASQESLAKSERLFRLALDGAPEGMAVIGLHSRFLQVNTALEAMLGRSEEWLLEHCLSDVFDPAATDLEANLRDQLVTSTGAVNADCLLQTASGEPLWVNLSMSLLREIDGMPLFFVAHLQDITAQREVQEQLEYDVTHDALTGALNRRAAIDAVAAVFSSDSTGRLHGLLFCDMDNFKQINDEFGHPSGDEVLVEVAARIRSAVRTEDFIGRVGGDEFLVVLNGLHHPNDAHKIASEIQEAIRHPLRIGGTQLVPSLTIGVCVSPPGTPAEEVLDAADAALYAAKRQERGSIATSVLKRPPTTDVQTRGKQRAPRAE